MKEKTLRKDEWECLDCDRVTRGSNCKKCGSLNPLTDKADQSTPTTPRSPFREKAKVLKLLYGRLPYEDYNRVKTLLERA